MTSNLLFVPYRKTQRIDLGKELREIISNEYYQTASVFAKDLQEVDTLRNDIIELGDTAHDNALLTRYYLHLSTLESKFPKDLVEFPWFGTLGYRVTGPVKIKSFLFERINLIYNIAALYSQIGTAQDRNSDEGLRKACLYFQYAATYFQYINELAKEDKTLTLPLDLQEGTIETLRFLSLAQAQEVFWQKAFGDKLKDSLIARLAIQVSAYYNQALQSANKSEGFRSEWISHMTVKKYHFEAAAEYRASLTSVSSSKYGEEVARLQRARKAISSASRNLKFVSQAVKDDFEGLSKIVDESFKRAEKDNDLIYLQEVPTDLPDIVKASVTKDMDIEEIKNPHQTIKTGKYGSQLFKDLLPFYVIQVSHAFRERQQEYVEKHIALPIRSLTKILHNFQFERDLPASIDAVDKPQALPASLLAHSQEIKAAGGTTRLKQTLKDISNLSRDGESLLVGAQERLDLEAQEDRLLRAKQGSNHWNRPTSEEAAADLHARIVDLAGYLKQAKEGDETVREQFKEIEPHLEVLCGTEEKIRDFIPNSKTRQLDPFLRRTISELRDVLSKARKLELDREQAIEVVQIKSEQYNIFPKVVSEYKAIQENFKDLKVDPSAFEPVFTKHIQNFSTDLDYIEKQKRVQKDLEDKIDELNTKFVRLNNSQGSNTDRQTALNILESAYLKYKQLTENLHQGILFYNEFNGKCSTLVADIDKFVYGRRIEARDLETELNSKFQNLELNSPKKSSRTSSLQRTSNNDFKPEEIERSASPALVAPKAQSTRTFKGGLWNPDSGIKFG